MCDKNEGVGPEMVKLAGNVLGGIVVAAPAAVALEWQAHADRRREEHEERMRWYEALPEPEPGKSVAPAPTPPWLL